MDELLVEIHFKTVGKKYTIKLPKIFYVYTVHVQIGPS